MGGGSKSSTTTSTTTPWAPQAGYLSHIFDQTNDLFENYQGNNYTGPFTAGQNDTQRTAIDQMLQAANASGTFGTNSINLGTQLQGNYQNAQAITDGLASGDPIAQELARRAMEDPTSGILSTAGLYADNPYVTGIIDSVGRDVSRNLKENDLPSLNLAAAGGGNMNSSRAGAAEAILTRGAQDRIADISAGVRGDAWNQGLAMAQAQRQNMFQNALTASNQDINTKLAAAGNYMNLGGVGTSLQAMGVENLANRANLTGQAGNAQQAEAQRQIDEARQQFSSNETQDWERLGNYYSIVGDKTWGGTQTQTAPKSGGSGLQTAMGALATVGGVVAAPFTGGASLAVTAAGVGMLGAGMAGGGGASGVASPQFAYGGGSGGYSGPQTRAPTGASAYQAATGYYTSPTFQSYGTRF